MIFAGITDLRNRLYDKGILKSVQFNIPVIAVGNLSVGGTGKSPHIAYLVSLLKNEFNVGILSRGYGRKTNHYINVQSNSSTNEVGDEPLMFKLQFPDVAVAVDVDRVQGIPQLLVENPQTELVLLDDAFQHRAVRAGLQIMLTAYDRLFTDDSVLPAGRLRERKSGYKRADIIVVTKCPRNILEEERQKISAKIRPLAHQRLYFSTVNYGEIYPLFSPQEQLAETCLVVTGIADSTPLERFLSEKFSSVSSQRYGDHHHFKQSDLEHIRAAFNDMGHNRTIVLTTEKDAARFLPYRLWFEQNRIPLYVQPICVDFLPHDKIAFDNDVRHFLKTHVSQS